MCLLGGKGEKKLDQGEKMSCFHGSHWPDSCPRANLVSQIRKARKVLRNRISNRLHFDFQATTLVRSSGPRLRTRSP